MTLNEAVAALAEVENELAGLCSNLANIGEALHGIDKTIDSLRGLLNGDLKAVASGQTIRVMDVNDDEVPY